MMEKIYMDYKTSIKIISWNVRGLNERDKRLAVRQTFFFEKPDMICLQETKLDEINDSKRKEICGKRLGESIILKAQHTRGGILIAWRDRRYRYVSHTEQEYCLSVRVEDSFTGVEMVLTGVYGPSRSGLTQEFFNELREARSIDDCPWIVCGDFNLTMHIQDRNRATSNWRGPLQFVELVSELELINLPMHGRNYTWSNGRESPTMAKLDRCLISMNWSLLFPNSTQRTLPNSSSDHCPVLYQASTTFKRSAMFRVENFWLQSQQFKDFVKNEWEALPTAQTPIHLNEKIGAI